MSKRRYLWLKFDEGTIERHRAWRAFARSWASSEYIVNWWHTRASRNKRLRHRARPNGRARGR